MEFQREKISMYSCYLQVISSISLVTQLGVHFRVARKSAFGLAMMPSCWRVLIGCVERRGRNVDLEAPIGRLSGRDLEALLRGHLNSVPKLLSSSVVGEFDRTFFARVEKDRKEWPGVWSTHSASPLWRNTANHGEHFKRELANT